MRSEVPRPTVAELQSEGVLLVEDGNHGEYRPRSSEFVKGGIAFIRAADMDGGCVQFEIAEGINEAAMARIRKGVGRPGDVLLSHKGTVGKVALVPPNAPRFVCSPQTTFWRVLDEQRIDRHYLFTYLRGPEFHTQLASRKGETDMADYVSLTAQRQLRVALPDIGTQREIGAIIGAIDNRIDLLHQTNATLESIAQALFKSWFIDFDPVRAKTEGREPEGMDAATSALFPAEFEKSALGLIPKGWRVERLGAVLELAYGKALKATDRKVGPVPVYGSGGITGYHDTPLVTEGSVIVGRKGTVGSLYWEDRPFYPIDTTFYVRVKIAPLTFCFYAMQGLGLEGMNTDAAVPGLNRENAYRRELVLPPAPVLKAFDDIVRTFRASMRCGTMKARSLAQMRDALLPRLISGKLRLPEAQEELEDALA